MDTAPLPPACSYLETVGNTPMVKLDRCVPAASKQATILCKLEMQNPGGSLKDRIALNMIEEAEARGDITPGKTTIIDFTSGNTGIGYAMVAAAKGYKCIVIMPKVRPMLERYLICRQFGAEVHLFNPSLGAPGALKYVKDQLAANPHYWWPNQLGNPDNPAVHERTTGPEIWKQAGGAVDYFIHGIGTGGCVAGVGKYLKSVNPKCRVTAHAHTRTHRSTTPLSGLSMSPSLDVAPLPHTSVGRSSPPPGDRARADRGARAHRRFAQAARRRRLGARRPLPVPRRLRQGTREGQPSPYSAPPAS